MRDRQTGRQTVMDRETETEKENRQRDMPAGRPSGTQGE